MHLPNLDSRARSYWLLCLIFIIGGTSASAQLGDYKLSHYMDMLQHLDTASLAQYQAWLKAYYKRGGSEDSTFDDPTGFASEHWFVAKPGLVIYPLYGAALSLNIIVPDSVQVRLVDRGDNQLFFANGYASPGARPWLYPASANLAKQ